MVFKLAKVFSTLFQYLYFSEYFKYFLKYLYLYFKYFKKVSCTTLALPDITEKRLKYKLKNTRTKTETAEHRKSETGQRVCERQSSRQSGQLYTMFEYNSKTFEKHQLTLAGARTSHSSLCSFPATSSHQMLLLLGCTSINPAGC